MLYGDRIFIAGLMQEIANVEVKNDINVVFGSTIGSISRGIQRYTSDYDLRFLYVDSSHNFLDHSERHIEDKIRYRSFNKEKTYNCTPFWEISAFINFLHEPYINQGVQYKLIRNVIWSFLSPYQYDPYGLSGKIMPLLLKAIDLDCEMNHHYTILKNSLKSGNPIVSLSVYFEIMHAYLSILWIKQEITLPPLHIVTLMSIADKNIYQHINRYIEFNRSFKDESVDSVNVEISYSIYKHFSDFMRNIKTKKVDIINKNMKFKPLVEKMLNIIEDQIKNEQTIIKNNDGN